MIGSSFMSAVFSPEFFNLASLFCTTLYPPVGSQSTLHRSPGEPAWTASPDDEVFLAFGRVYSGTARPGQVRISGQV